MQTYRKGAKTVGTKTSDCKIYLFIQETDHVINAHNMLVWCSDFLCNDDFHSIHNAQYFALTLAMKT